MNKFNTTLWIALIFISMKYLQSADSLQCFECENCATIGDDAREYIKECTPLESFSSTERPESTTTNENEFVQSSTPSSSSSTSINNTTNSLSSLASSNSTLLSSSTLPTTLNKTETTRKLQFGSSEVSTTQSSLGSSTTQKQKVTSSIWSMLPNSIEENEFNKLKPEIEDQSDELFSWKTRQAGDVCYVLKLNYGGNEITKRGCGLRGQDKVQTCKLLSKGEPNSECEVCEGDLCNSGSKLRTGVMGLLLSILLVLKAYF